MTTEETKRMLFTDAFYKEAQRRTGMSRQQLQDKVIIFGL